MKFKIEVGGYVTIYRHRTYTIYANSAEEAEEKAIDRFIEQQCEISDGCDEGHINSIEKMEG